ncbi:MAG: class I SAM-dependent methyltransferase, partial [Anaerolineales bacterium]
MLEGPDRLTGLPGRFKLIRCGNCGLIRQNPRLEWESLRQYYPKDYSPYEPIIESESSIFRRFDRRYGMRKRLRAIERLQKGGRLIDVGCGTGIFLAEAERSGRWELMGVEPNLDAVRYASQRLDCSILQARFSEPELPTEGFDVVTMW